MSNKKYFPVYSFFLIVVLLTSFVFAYDVPSCKNAVLVSRSRLWQAINSGQCSSASVAIMDNGKIVYAEGFAMADREKNIPVDPNTIFNIASISKMFVTTAIMLLVDDGKIQLDKPVVDYLPEFKMSDKRYKDITVRMLLNHTSGIPGTQWANSLGTRYNSNIHSDTLNTLKNSDLIHEPGEIAVYCNDGFTLAEMIVEKAGKKKYLDFLSERIFKPLNLKHTTLTGVGIENSKKAKLYNNKNIKAYPPEVISLLGAGGISSTPTDLCIFADSFSDFNNILKKNSLLEMKKAQPSKLCGKLQGESYGLGWDVTDIPKYKKIGLQIFSKGGSSAEYKAMLFTIPEKRLTVAVVGTAAQGGAIISIALEIMDALLIDKGLSKKEEKTAEFPLEIKSEKIPENQFAYAGYFNGNFRDPVKIDFDREKNIMSIKSLKEGEDNPSVFTYNNGYFTDESNSKYYFTSFAGRSFLVEKSGLYDTDYIAYEKFQTLENQKSLKEDINNKLWLRRNVLPFESQFFVNLLKTHMIRSNIFTGLPGYVNFNGLKSVKNPVTTGMPSISIADQTELFLFENDGKTWIRNSDMIYSPEDTACILNPGNKTVKISKNGFNEWLKTQEDLIIDFTRPSDSRVIIFNINNDPIYDTMMDSGNIFVPKGSFIELSGYPNDIFTINARNK